MEQQQQPAAATTAFRVCSDPRRGRHLVAARDLLPNELVLKESAIVVGPATKTVPVCLGCLVIIGNNNNNNNRCSSCNFPMCSKDCEDSLIHARECGYLSKYGIAEEEEENAVYACVFLLRAWLAGNHNYHHLMSGESDAIGPAITSHCFDIMKKLGVTDMTEKDVATIMGIKRINACSLADGVRKGSVLYRVYPLMNSHCYCNTSCRISQEDMSMEVRTKMAVKAGDELTTRYVPAVECCQPYRQMDLWDNWKFLCDCTRCKDPTEFGTFFSAIRCWDCKVGYLLPKTNVLMLASPWVCGNCGATRGHREALEALETCKTLVSQHSSNNPRMLLELLLERLHPNHCYIFSFKESILFKSAKPELSSELTSMAKDLLDILERLDPGNKGRKIRLQQIVSSSSIY